MFEAEIVIYNPHDGDTYPSVCNDPKEVEARFGFTGGETLIFDHRGNYIGQLIKGLPRPPTGLCEWH